MTFDELVKSILPYIKNHVSVVLIYSNCGDWDYILDPTPDEENIVYYDRQNERIMKFDGYHYNCGKTLKSVKNFILQWNCA
jgi:hypothetical protein